MELEQRVKLLEQEVKLLKNEVQVTLLDIQEQLLSTRHLGLRAEAGLPLETPVAMPGDPSAERSAPAKALPRIDPSSAVPPIKANAAVSGNGGRAVKVAPLPAQKPVPGAGDATRRLPKQTKLEAEAKPALPLDWEALRRQTDWTIQTVRQHGLEHTRRLIEVYAREGLLSEKASGVLQQVAMTFQADGLPAGKVPAANTARPAKPDKAQLRNAIVRLIQHLQLTNAKQEARRG